MQEPPPLSSFFDAAAGVATRPKTTTTKRKVKKVPSQSSPSPCLLAPEFLGCHTLATLGDVLSLDGGRLRVWSGAAVHNDQAAMLVEAQNRARRAAAASGLAESADQLFSAVSASGSRLLGGPFLRCETGDKQIHVWLNPTGNGSQPTGPALEHDGHLDAERIVHSVGAYRLRVLSSRVIDAAGGGEDSGLQQAETLEVRIAVDRVRSAAAVSELDAALLPVTLNAETTFWLSTQGASHVCLSHGTPSAVDPLAATDAAATAGCLPPLTPPPTSSLPPIDGGSARARGSTVAASEGEEDSGSCEAGGVSVDVSLHATPLPPESGRSSTASAPAAFGVPPTAWRVELSAMTLGGGHEAHAVLPLQPTSAITAEAAGDTSEEACPSAAREMSLGPYRLRVLQCVGHHVSGDVSVGRVVSEYPLLLLHAQVALTLTTPLLQVQSASAAAHADDEVGEASPPLSSAEAERRAARREAQLLGDELERLLELG